MQENIKGDELIPSYTKDLSKEILSDIIVYMKYSRYIDEIRRRETWEEICDRNMNMHIKRFPTLKKEIISIYNKFVKTKKVLPSMRSLQFGGKPIEVNNSRIYNCTYLPAKDIKFFSELMFLLLGGSGVGYSVQKHHVEQIPIILLPTKERKFVIEDSIAGWADAIKVLFKSYTQGSSKPIFDFNQIRQKGSKLITAGGLAPGPAPLRICLTEIQSILDQANNRKLTTLEVHEIACHVADAVLAGGIRRASLIAFFTIDDLDMLTCKSGNWWELHPEFARCNNSVVLERGKVTYNEFKKLWERIKESGAGEPGIIWVNNKEILGNPCLEISLQPYGVCNLTEINSATIESQEDLNERCKAAAFIGTLQASYTDFYYLREIWKKTAEEEALLGISMTGIASNNISDLDLQQAAKVAVDTNREISSILQINPAKRITTIKPAGTTSLVLGCSSGIHAYHAPYYIRRMRVGKNEPIYNYLKTTLPELIEDEYFRPQDTAVISIPQKAPEHAIMRTESALALLERSKNLYTNWILPGHIEGESTHNISITVSLKEQEWDTIGDWMWVNKDYYNGIAVLPYEGGIYKQAPFEECTKEVFEKMYSYLKKINLKDIIEETDNTNLSGELACSSGNCEIQ